jgi:hypothetical protein
MFLNSMSMSKMPADWGKHPHPHHARSHSSSNCLHNRIKQQSFAVATASEVLHCQSRTTCVTRIEEPAKEKSQSSRNSSRRTKRCYSRDRTYMSTTNCTSVDILLQPSNLVSNLPPTHRQSTFNLQILPKTLLKNSFKNSFKNFVHKFQLKFN